MKGGLIFYATPLFGNLKIKYDCVTLKFEIEKLTKLALEEVAGNFGCWKKVSQADIVHHQICLIGPPFLLPCP